MSTVSSKKASGNNIKQYEQIIDKQIEELIKGFEFYDIFYGDDLNLDLIGSEEMDKVLKLLGDITDSEKTIVNELEQELLSSIEYNKEDKRALKKLKVEFRKNLITLDKNLRDNPDTINQHTFKYHFARIPYAKDAIKKKKADISQLQLELEENEITEELKEQYIILVKLNLQLIKHETLGNVFLTSIDSKKDLYYRLTDVIDKQLKRLKNKIRRNSSLQSARSPTSMAGKKKTKKRKNPRKIMKSKKKKKIQKGSGSSEHKCFDAESIKNYNKEYDDLENTQDVCSGIELSVQLDKYINELDLKKKVNPPTIQLIPYCGENEKGIPDKSVEDMKKFIPGANLNEINNETIQILESDGLLKIDTSRIKDEEKRNNQTIFKSESSPEKFIDFMKDEINTNMLIVTHGNFLIQLYNLLHKDVYKNENVINLDEVDNIEEFTKRYKIKCKRYNNTVNFANLDILAIYLKNNEINGIKIFRFNENYEGINNLKDDENVIFLMRHCYACHNFIMNKVRKTGQTGQTEPNTKFNGLMSNCLIGTIQTMKNNSSELSEVLNNNKFEYGSSVLLRSITTCMLQYYISQNK